MFKKLKDKLTEEVKIPSQKFTQSMQQLAQAVVSPVSSNNSTFDTASNDNFSIDGDSDDTPQGSPVKQATAAGGVAYRGGQATPIRNSFDAGSRAGFSHVDLQQSTSTPKMPPNRSASVSSLSSDSSFMFPVMESSGPAYNFQSDLESCSEASESVGPNINKEQILLAYQKIQQKYHKYKGRYADLAKHYRDLERDNKNAKHILTECQDKALRRMAELKEQCNLEKQAKAHLEEALRSDLEEKDHLIDTLKTKYCDAELQIKLLRTQVEQVQAESLDEKSASPELEDTLKEQSSMPIEQEDLLTGADSGPGTTAAMSFLTPEPANAETDNVLRDKVKKLESLLHKAKDDIANKRESIKQLESEKNSANVKIKALEQQLVTIKKQEEEAALSLAKNKQTIHQELESKEDEIKRLNAQLTAVNSKVSELQSEVVQNKEDSKKEIAANKAQVVKLMKNEVDELLSQKKKLEELLATTESEQKAREEKAAELLKRLDQQELELNFLRTVKEDSDEKHTEETKLLNEEILKLQSCMTIESDKGNNSEKLKHVLGSLRELQGLHKQLKNDAQQSQVDNMEWISEQAQLNQEKIKVLVSDVILEHQRICAELEKYKNESVKAQESLTSVSEKFAHLQQSLSEKSEMESKISTLKKELDASEKQITLLDVNLSSERSNHQVVLNDYMSKLTTLQNELDKEKTKNMEVLEGSSSAEIKMKLLTEQVEHLEQEKVKISGENGKFKEMTNELQMTTEQLQQELGILKTRDRESMNEMTSMQMLLDGKNEHMESLESMVSDLEGEVSAALAERNELEKKWTVQEEELVLQISEIRRKHQEALDTIKDLQEKESLRVDGDDATISSLQTENAVKGKHIVELQSRLQDSEDEMKNIATKNTELQNEADVLGKKYQELEAAMVTLNETNINFSQSVKQLQEELKEKTVRLKNLESSSVELERVTAEKSQLSSCFVKLEEDLQVKIQEVESLRANLDQVNSTCFELKQTLSSKTQECVSLADELGKLNLVQSEQIKMLQAKSDDCVILAMEKDTLEVEMSQFKSMLEHKTKEYESIQFQLLDVEKKQMEESEGNIMKKVEFDKQTQAINRLENEKLELTKTVQNKCLEVEKIVSELSSLKQEFLEQSKVIQGKVIECGELKSKLDSLTAENEKVMEQLKQKTVECEDKEDQLDNLADEMKQVEELSQELHRINDDRDANVEVLSSEASSLAQKVEELTISTQELKEREVDLLSKLEVAQDLEAEYISMKHREEMLLLELNELKGNDKDLSEKNKQIDELVEDNKKLREAGQNLNEVINRAREAEAKCEKLQNDGADFLLRIQKAEEMETRCLLLEAELDAIKKEKVELTQEVQMLQSKSVFKSYTTDERSASAREPVIEELCTAKHFADLTEKNQSSEGNEWKDKYHKLLEEHKMALQENADMVERLKEENLLSEFGNSLKKKERLWDPEPLTSLPDGNSNGSFVTVEKLQQQLTVVTTQLKESKKLHRQEVDDLRRILLNHGSSNSHASSRSDNLEDATELEYLRNILFEYMMGKEPMILARVIAAVVKFDSEQTSKVLQKEQQRLSLLGHLGIS